MRRRRLLLDLIVGVLAGTPAILTVDPKEYPCGINGIYPTGKPFPCCLQQSVPCDNDTSCCFVGPGYEVKREAGVDSRRVPMRVQ